jgi:hypothetical protein
MSSNTTLCANVMCANKGLMNNLVLETSSDSNTGDVTSAANSVPLLTLKNTNTDAASGAVLQMKSHPSDNAQADLDEIGLITFVGVDDAGAAAEYGAVLCSVIDATAASENGKLSINITANGARTEVMSLTSAIADTTAAQSAVAIPGTLSVTGGVTQKRPVYHSVAQTAAKTFTTADSGTLVILASTASQIQVFNLPTIASAADIGTYFDFLVLVSGNSAAAGSYTINTGGNASDLAAAPTAGYDDYHVASKLLIAEPTIVATADKLQVSPTNGDGTLVLADDTSNAIIATGTYFRATAVAVSTTTASADVWFLEGVLMTTQATGFVTGALFTAP